MEVGGVLAVSLSAGAGAMLDSHVGMVEAAGLPFWKAGDCNTENDAGACGGVVCSGAGMVVGSASHALLVLACINF